ncbi:hypothetical protein BDP55DRAFT_630978 [Colletotrichum godetiae]|uniref:Aminoglycoside phosphotransferase domain-containing protein n=1 Tax=Colletotrichum godetiae TaxID=1209918 RepID=A0AAJ0AN09_9PEZI|nr:uncharacterized protein BDP55DRAFT_630978 [Colletotrichum godetiae]KAK1676893.1 hypothetical protein BDP55DRAFT_630978 [Colletotrichum godetiae]
MTSGIINPNGLFLDFYVMNGIPELGEDDGKTSLSLQVLENNMTFCAILMNFKEGQPPTGIPLTAALTRLAQIVLPSLVPEIWGRGYTRMKDVLPRYLSAGHSMGCVIDDENRGNVIGDLFEAMSKLRCLSLKKLTFEQWQYFRNTPFETKITEYPILCGGSSYGYHTDFASFLQNNLWPRNTGSAVNTKPDGTLVVSVPATTVEYFGFAETNLDLLTQSSVLCHNDLEPRNLVVEKISTERGEEFKLMAILNWDQAGF